jgi:HEAT repeat protein
MTATAVPTVRHPFESEMITSSLNGDIRAVHRFLKYLGSAYPQLCQIIQETIHDLDDARIWRNLLCCLALHRWNETLYCDWHSVSSTSERIDDSIIEVFVKDETTWEKSIKENVLQNNLDNPELEIRQAAAYLLGLRGDHRVIPVLAEILENGTKEWQLRAVKALAVLKDERCAQPLLKLLITGRGELHREAGRALWSLGELAKSSWLEALKHHDSHIRWHAARGLGEIGDQRHAMILAEGLYDTSYAVRWATADVLAHLGSQAVPAILTILSRYEINESFRQAAYHALHGISSSKAQESLKPLMDAMRDFASNIEIPMIAQRLLAEWPREE